MVACGGVGGNLEPFFIQILSRDITFVRLHSMISAKRKEKKREFLLK